ncbi:MAG: hypothetical protein JWQ57_196 [Mucilaginibacter sp.]|nr:hypothetical protein [Mucilaginibacter sp.]
MEQWEEKALGRKRNPIRPVMPTYIVRHASRIRFRILSPQFSALQGFEMTFSFIKDLKLQDNPPQVQAFSLNFNIVSGAWTLLQKQQSSVDA